MMERAASAAMPTAITKQSHLSRARLTALRQGQHAGMIYAPLMRAQRIARLTAPAAIGYAVKARLLRPARKTATTRQAEDIVGTGYATRFTNHL